MPRSSVNTILVFCLFSVTPLQGPLSAHESHSHRDPPIHLDEQETQLGLDASRPTLSLNGPVVEAFEPFASEVSARVSGSYLVIESNGLPTHDMMIGITAWQQQVPLPQPFRGDNAWRLPLNPRPASDPISVLKEPLRGAIALAVNGVPIFCALNNRAEDTFLAGELDQWGGHCGRGDDYHYHIAPVHLEQQVGVGNPIAYALDGYPILGLADADGSVPDDLDPFNGHTHDGNYHYHATKTFPYINGGLYGEVQMQGDQIEQPRDSPTRPGQPPLRGARITDFRRDGNDFDLTYEVSGAEAHVRYRLLDDERVQFTYVDTSGIESTQTYRRGQPGGQVPIGVLSLAGVLVLVSGIVLWLVRRRTVVSRSA